MAHPIVQSRPRLGHTLLGILFVVVGVASRPAYGQATQATVCSAVTPVTVAVTGTVVDQQGTAVADAELVALCGDLTVRGQSDATGQFRLALTPGPYTLHIVKVGMEPASQDFVVGAEPSPPLSVVMRIAAYTESVTVVSAAAVERSLRDAPASVAVVTAAEIETRPIRDLSDALAMVEGVTVRRSGNTVPTVQLRGLDSAYTLILIDGKRVNATSAMFRGNDYDTGWIPPQAVERVEVVRGPMSSLYGSDAIGGVVNIITKRVGTQWSGGATGSLNLQTNRNAGDAYLANVSVAGPLLRDRLGLKAYGGADRRDADGTINPTQAGGAAPLPGFPATDNRFIATDVTIVPDTRQDMTVHFDGSRRDHGGFVMTRTAGSFGHKGRWGRTSSDVLVYGDIIRNLVGTVTGQVNPNRATSAVAEGRLNIPFLAHVVTIGGQHRHEALEDPANLTGLPGTPTFGHDPRVSIWQSAAFGEADVALGSRLRLTLGDRFDYHQNFGGNHSPRLYGVYHPLPSLSLKAGVSRAFRAPTLLQTSPTWGSVSCGSATTGCFIIGSGELDPETSTSGEVSVQFDRGAWATGITFFRNDLKNMIDITNRTANAALAPTFPNFVGFLPAGPPGNGRPIFRYQNINQVRTQGIEATLRYSLSSRLQVRSSYGYLKAENFSGVTPVPLVYRPAHTFTTSTTWQLVDWLSVAGLVRANGAQFINVPATGVGAQSRGGYTIVDASAAWQVDRRFSVRGGLLNVANQATARTTSLDFNEESRRVFLQLSVSF